MGGLQWAGRNYLLVQGCHNVIICRSTFNTNDKSLSIMSHYTAMSYIQLEATYRAHDVIKKNCLIISVFHFSNIWTDKQTVVRVDIQICALQA